MKTKKLFGGEIPNLPTINDVGYRFIFPMSKIQIGKRYKLEEIIKHDELFKTFPEYKKINVTFEEIKHPDINAFAETTFGKSILDTEIVIGLHFDYYRKHKKEKYELRQTDYPERSKEAVLLHEMQHACQFTNRRPYGQSYISIESAVLSRNNCISREDAERAGIAGRVEREIEFAYKSQPPEQEAIHAVYIWLHQIGLSYGNKKILLFTDYLGDEQRNSQEGFYSSGGKLKTSFFQFYSELFCYT